MGQTDERMQLHADENVPSQRVYIIVMLVLIMLGNDSINEHTHTHKHIQIHYVHNTCKWYAATDKTHSI